MTATITERAATDFGSLDIVTTREDLADALTFVSAVAIPSRVALPVLAGVRITPYGVSAFDYETSATHGLFCDVASKPAGEIITNAAELLQLVKGLDKGSTVRLHTVAGDRLAVTGDGVTYTVALLPVSDAPAVREPSGRYAFTLTGDRIGDVLASLTSAGKDDALPALTGAYFDPAGDTWHVAATDRYRLSVCDTGQSVPADSRAFLVPAAKVAQLKRFSDEIHVSAEITGDDVYADGWATFTDGMRTMTTRLLGGAFPKYRRLFPEAHELAAVATFPAAGALKAVKRASAVIGKTTPVRFELGELVTVAAGNEFDSSACATVPGATRAGELLTVGANHAYVADAIGAFGSKDETVTVSFWAATKPMVWMSDARPALRILLMPVRLSS